MMIIKMFIVIGQDDNNTHTLWTDMGGGWSRVQQVATSSGDKSPILFSHWVHHEHLMVKNNEYHFVSGGLKGIMRNYSYHHHNHHPYDNYHHHPYDNYHHHHH